MKKTIAEINATLRELAEYTRMQDELTAQIDSLKDEIKASAPIINRALQVLGGTGKVYEIGTFRGKMNYYKGVSETMKKRPKYYIQKIQTANKNTHFRIVNYDGKVIFDPYDPAPKAIKIEYSIIYAYNGEAK